MLGAIIGDIIGSAYEFRPHKSKEFPLFSEKSEYTDDTIMTLAVANSLVICKGNSQNLSTAVTMEMRRLGNKYPYAGYGGDFRTWIRNADLGPYNSYGNGAAMRISPVGFVSKTVEEAKDLAYKVTCVTHNHEEGLKGAEAVAVSIVLIKQGYTKERLEKYINDNYYNMSFSLNEIRASYHFDETCQGSVPQAIKCFLEASSFEDTIRNCVSLGGDADTMAAIAGSLAEAFYGIKDQLKVRSLSYLPDDLKQILTTFYNTFRRVSNV